MSNENKNRGNRESVGNFSFNISLGEVNRSTLYKPRNSHMLKTNTRFYVEGVFIMALS